MVPMVGRATFRCQVTCRMGRLLALLGLLPLLVLQPLGATAIVLHDHDHGDHVHVLSGQETARYVSGESGWHLQRRGDPAAGDAHDGDHGEPLDTKSPGTLIVLNTSDTNRVHVKASAVQTTPSVRPADIPRWQMPPCWFVAQAPSPPPRWRNHGVSRRAGIAAILLRNHALLL